MSTLSLWCIKASGLRATGKCVVMTAASADAVSEALLVLFERVRIPRRSCLTEFFHCHGASLSIQKNCKKIGRDFRMVPTSLFGGLQRHFFIQLKSRPFSSPTQVLIGWTIF